MIARWARTLTKRSSVPAVRFALCQPFKRLLHPTTGVRTLAAGQYGHIPTIVGASAEDEFE